MADFLDPQPILIVIRRFLYAHIAYPWNFLEKISVLRVLGLKKASKFDLFQKCKTKIFIFEYFPKLPSEMNSTHTFYPILLPNTIVFRGVPKVLCAGVKLNFSIFFFIWSFAIKSWEKSRIFRYGLPEDYF